MFGAQGEVSCREWQRTRECKAATACEQSWKVRHWFCANPGRLNAVGGCGIHWKLSVLGSHEEEDYALLFFFKR